VDGAGGAYRVASIPSITGILRSIKTPSKRSGFSAEGREVGEEIGVKGEMRKE
jgi:hypothetical protein